MQKVDAKQPFALQSVLGFEETSVPGTIPHSNLGIYRYIACNFREPIGDTILYNSARIELLSTIPVPVYYL